MKLRVLFLAVFGISIAGVATADDTKTTPRRGISGSGGLGGSGFGIYPAKQKERPQKIIKHITYMAASPKRSWTSTDGKTIVAALLAFDPDPKKPKTPVIVKDGKIRLLKGNKPFVLPLTRLQKTDQDYVQKIATAAKTGVVQQPGKVSEKTATKKPVPAAKKE